MIGERIKMLRSENKLTMKELGGILGVSDGAINKYEKNQAYPSYDIMIKLADHFNVSMDFLFARTNIRNEKTIQDIKLLNGLIKDFEKAKIGDTTEMICFFANLSFVIQSFNAKDISEKEFQLLLNTINNITIFYSDLLRLKSSNRNFSLEVLSTYQDCISQLISNLNTMISLMFNDLNS